MPSKAEQLPDISPFIIPPEDIVQAVRELEAYYQMTNQNAVALYEKWKEPKKDKSGRTLMFSGTLGEGVALEEIRKLLDIARGKPWEDFIKAIFLIKNYKTELELAGLADASPETQIETFKVITTGLAAAKRIKAWLAPIDKQDVLTAIFDAMEVEIGNDRYDTFQVLKFADLKSDSSSGKIGLFPDILEIDNPHALVEYFKTQPKLAADSLLITFMRDKNYAFKNPIYLFLIYHNSLYVLDASERRFNLENTAGARTGGERYFEGSGKFAHVWLPFDVMMSEEKGDESTAITVRNKKIFRRGAIQDMFAKSPEFKAWLEMFLIRVIEFITTNQNKIEIAYTPSDIIPALEDKTQKVEERVKLRERRGSFESEGDSSSYLVRKYGNKVTAIVPQQKELPVVIGTKTYIEGVVKYKQRESVAKSLYQILIEDYLANSPRVYGWFKDFVAKQNKDVLVKKGLMAVVNGTKFPYIRYLDTFTDTQYIDGKAVPAIKKPTETLETIAAISSYFSDYHENDGRIVKLSKDGKLYEMVKGYKECGARFEARDGNHYTCDKKLGHPHFAGHSASLSKYHNMVQKNAMCYCCDKHRGIGVLRLRFEDYVQFCAYFGLTKEQVPPEFVEHFHQQNNTYVGNSILSDTDPVDEIEDPWFRHVTIDKDYKNRILVGGHNIVNRDDKPALELKVPLCGFCIKRLGAPSLVSELKAEAAETIKRRKENRKNRY